MSPKNSHSNFFAFSKVEEFKGLPDVDVDKCTACGVCSINCPTRAISIVKIDKRIVHRIYAGKCIACGRCQEVCPEEAIFLSKRMGMIDVAESQLVIEKEINAVICKLCGTPFASKLQMEKIKENLRRYGHDVKKLLSLNICHKCRSNLTKKIHDKIIYRG